MSRSIIIFNNSNKNNNKELLTEKEIALLSKLKQDSVFVPFLTKIP